jgi:D-alanine-D-alanine ligase
VPVSLPDLPVDRFEDVSVAVVCGGTSSEGAVSKASGEAVYQALRERMPRLAMVELDAGLIPRLTAGEFDVVFPALHGRLGEDGTFQGLLDFVGVPYVGSGVRASACAMDKVIAQDLFRAAGLPVAAAMTVTDDAFGDSTTAAITETLGRNVVVKPAAEGSAVGVAFASSDEELATALSRALEFGPKALVEERVEGAEITVGVLEADGPQASPLVEVRTPEGAWYDYEHRYTPGLSEHLVPAPVDPAVAERVREVACAAHETLGCRDLSRVDFVVGPEGRIALLEVNTLPGLTPTSLFPDAMKAAGAEFPQLLSYLVLRALERTTASAA